MSRGFTISDELYRSQRVMVARAVRHADQAQVILKVILATALDPLGAAKLRHEKDMLDAIAQLGCAGVPRCLALVNDEGRPGLVLEDIGGVSLMLAHKEKPLSVAEVLLIAVQIADTLSVVHRARVVHKDINPSNIIYNRATKRAQLIDFSIASPLSHETQQAESLRSLEGTPAYMPPEQTGRTSRAVDHRADFYALGATLYTVLGGALPFEHTELADLIYNILTTVPTPLMARNSSVPPGLSTLVARLMAKAPEERYQSVHGLVHDLRRCETAWAQGDLSVFALGTADRDETFSIPQRLYGRDAVVRGLQEVYDAAQKGGVRCVLLRGLSGIGKSSIMQDLQPRILAGHGLYLAGKHDQLQHHVAFGSLRQAIDMLMRQILKEPANVVSVWQYRLQAALGRIGRPMLDLVPSLGNLIGPQRALVDLGPRETENRFLNLLEGFIRALTVDQPLVLFLDDLQWADSGTLKLLQIIATTPEKGTGLLVVGAYRSNEVGSAHPLRKCIDAMWKAGVTSEFEVGPLAISDLVQMLADTTRRTSTDVMPLADLLWQRSTGNPFFIHELLKYLWDRRLMEFDPQAGGMRWDIAAIGDAGLPDNVVALVTEKIRVLGAREARAIGYAACIGDVVPLSVLATTLGLSPPETLMQLHPLLEASLLIPQGSAYRYAVHSGEEVWVKFAHDRVRQAALELLPSAEAQAIHLSAARHLRKSLPSDAAAAALFDVVEHYHSAVDGITDAAEQRDVAVLSQRAAKEALRAVAYGAARRCLDMAAMLRARLGEPDHDTQGVAIEVQRAELDMLAGDHVSALGRLEVLLHGPLEVLDRGRIHTRRVTILMDQGKPRQAMNVCSEALKELGYAATESSANLIGNGLRLLLRIGKPRAGMFVDLPECKNARALVALALLSEGGTAAHECGAKAFLGTSILMNVINLEHGRSVYSAQAVLNLCVISCVLSNYPAVREFGAAANRLFELGPLENAAGCAFARAMFLSHLDMGPAELSQVLQNAHQMGRETGNATFAMWSVLGAFGYMLHVSLDAVQPLHDRYIGYLANRRGNLQYDYYYQSVIQVTRCLRGETADPLSLSDATFNEAEVERYAADHPQDSTAVYFHLWRLMIHYLHDDIDGAQAIAIYLLETHALQTFTDASVPTLCFYGALSFTAHAARAQRTKAPRVGKFVKKMRALAQIVPKQYGGELALIEAELAALAKQRERAIMKYGEACARLSSSGWIDRRAVANRRASIYFANIGLAAPAQAYASAAYSFFEGWGAKVVTARMRDSKSSGYRELQVMRTNNSMVTTDTTVDNLDVRAMMSFAHAISNEVSFEGLFATLLSVLKKAAGASRAALLFVDQGALRLAADTAPLGESVPVRITQYVARSKEPVLLPDVSRPGDFADSHFAAHDTGSAMAVPVIYRGEAHGVVYLENFVASAVFSPARLMLVEFLAAQAATAIENMNAHANLERIVVERTQDLERTHVRLLAAQRDSTELQMAGGFAHEMRNALSGAQLALCALRTMDEWPGISASILPHILRIGDTPETLFSLPAAQRAEFTAALQQLSENRKDGQDLLQLIEIGIERGQQVTSTVLAYADASTLVPPRALTDLPALLHALLAEQQQAFSNLGIAATVQASRSAALSMNEEHAATILRNLLANACDALAAKPEGPRTIIVRAETAHRGTLIHVDDSGMGVSAAASWQLFTPFYTTKGTKGSGLGLALSRKLARAYGGDLTFTPRDGGGASFQLLVPDLGKLPAS